MNDEELNDFYRSAVDSHQASSLAKTIERRMYAIGEDELGSKASELASELRKLHVELDSKLGEKNE